MILGKQCRCQNVRAVLKSHGNGVTVDTTHEKTEETSDGQELVECLGVNGGDLEKTENDHVDNHGPFATKLVSRETEDGSTDGAEKQSKGDGSGDVGVGSVIVFGKLGGLNGQGVEVKGIGTPSGETDDEEEPVLGAQLSHETDGVLQRLRGPPFSVLLAVFIADNNSLFPDEEVPEGLFGSWDDTLCNGVSRLVNGSHDSQRWFSKKGTSGSESSGSKAIEQSPGLENQSSVWGFAPSIYTR